MNVETSVDTWIAARGNHETLLFDGEQSLAALALTATLSGSYAPGERERRKDLEKSIGQILMTHDENAGCNGNAIFGLIDPEDRSVVSGLTEQVIFRWERACRRAKPVRPSPFAAIQYEESGNVNFDRADVQLIVETAAGVIDVLQAGYPKSPPESQNGLAIAKIIAQHGPEFAARWVRGDCIREFCEARRLNADCWLALLSTNSRTTIIMKAPGDPFSRLEIFINRYSQTEPQFLAKQLHIDAETATDLFTTFTRVNLALFVKDPVEALRAALQAFNTTCTAENIATELGYTVEQVEAIFTAKDRMQLALKHDPMHEVRRIAKLSTDLHAKFELPPKILRKLCKSSAPNAIMLATKLQKSKADCPPDVNMGLWLWAVMEYPGDTERATALRHTYIQKCLALRNILSGSRATNLDDTEFTDEYEPDR